MCMSALHIFYVQFLLLMPITRKISKMVYSNSLSHQNESASNELICKTEIESKMWKTNLSYQGDSEVGRDHCESGTDYTHCCI